jgi:hypothetical protein
MYLIVPGPVRTVQCAYLQIEECKMLAEAHCSNDTITE